MSTAIAPVQDATEKNIYESLALRGDMSALDSKDKAIYLQKLCESMGLNPYTQPFIPLTLKQKVGDNWVNKEILYASRGATDQLASINKLTREILKTERVEDVYVATCKVSAPDGRFDISTGAVTIGSLKGDALANALMKAETKAKRRATLSFCGLGFLDESEIETIPANRVEYQSPKPPLQIPSQTVETPKSEIPTIDAAPLSGQEIAMREEGKQLLMKTGTNPDLMIAKFNSAAADKRADWLTAVRKKAIKWATAADNDGWGYSEDGTIGFLDKHGIVSIDDATDAQIERCVDELRSLGNL